ncbi:hypothetical protein WSM22_02830 [Cytophagales bacterium WSM2-2]|nr:hypothetical protein WSM22_02830 [Cytophagales bacterium WSM2-2]
MEKGTKIALGITGVLAAAGIGYLVYSKTKKPTDTNTGNNAGSSSGSSSGPAQNVLDTVTGTINNAQGNIADAQAAYKQIQQAAGQLKPAISLPANTNNLKDGQGIRSTSGSYNGYVYLYTLSDGYPLKQWIKSNDALLKYLGSRDLNSLINQGKVVNLPGGVVDSIQEGSPLSGFTGLGNVVSKLR